MKSVFHSIPVKICLSLLIIEAILLSIMGGYYVRTFEKEIDQRVREKLALPGTLMSQRALNFDSVKNYSTLGELIQEKVEKALIVNRDLRIFYSADGANEGRELATLLDPAEKTFLEQVDEPNRQLSFTTSLGVHYRSSLSQIRHDGKMIGHLYIRINSEKIEKENTKVILLFLYGSIVTILLTSLLEALLVYRIFVPRIKNISSTLYKVEHGELDARVTPAGAVDELRILGSQVNAMIRALTEKIDELTTTRAAVAKNELRFRELSELLPESIFEMDREGNLTYVNRHASTIFQYSREEFYTKVYFVNLFAKEDRERVLKAFKLLLAQKITGFVEYTAIRKDSTTFPIMINASPIVDKEKVVGIRGLGVDITERNRIQDHLQQAQKMEAIGRLSASIAHEFGNPLIGVHWLLKELKNLPSLDSATHELLDVGLQECSRMRELLYDFQGLSKPSSGNKENFDIHDLLNKCVLFFRKFFKDNEVKVNCSFQAEHSELLASRGQINQVCLNLLINAIEALPEEGKEISISTANRDNNLLIMIGDNGSGISEEDLDRIFEPFFTTKYDMNGNGLGLYVSYAIVKRHQGEIDILSRSGRGTTFTISLPLESKNV